jgi:hypothetical protein
VYCHFCSNTLKNHEVLLKPYHSILKQIDISNLKHLLRIHKCTHASH